MNMLVGLFPDLLPTGGIQRVSRHVGAVLKQMAEDQNCSVHLLSLNDSPGRHELQVEETRFTVHGFGRDKRRFALALMKAGRHTRLAYIAHPNLAPLGLVLKLINPGARYIVAAHGTEVWQPLPKLRRLGLLRASIVTSPSEFTAAKMIEAQKIDSARVVIVPWAIDPQLLKRNGHASHTPRQLPAGKILLTVGRMDASEQLKGIDDVIRVLPSLMKKVPGTSYVIVGDGDDRPRLQRLAEEMKVEKQVHFIGSPGDQELMRYYDACDIFVMPSRQEGFGLVFLEAMACGKPVIGGSYGGATDVVVDNVTGFLVSHGDVSSLEDRLVRLLQDEELCRRMGEAGRGRVKENYTFEVFRQRLTKVLNGSERNGHGA